MSNNHCLCSFITTPWSRHLTKRRRQHPSEQRIKILPRLSFTTTSPNHHDDDAPFTSPPLHHPHPSHLRFENVMASKNVFKLPRDKSANSTFVLYQRMPQNAHCYIMCAFICLLFSIAESVEIYLAVSVALPQQQFSPR